MAMTINSSPVLIGKSAEAFMEEAQKKSQYPTPTLSPEREAQLRELEKASRELYLYLFGKK